MTPKFRISKTSKGYVSEYRVRRWFRYKWVPFITFMGSREIFHFQKYQNALEATLDAVEDQITNNNQTW